MASTVRSIYARSRFKRTKEEVLLEELRVTLKRVDASIESIEKRRRPRKSAFELPVEDVKMHLRARNLHVESLSTDDDLRRALARSFARAQRLILEVDTEKYCPDDDEVFIQLRMRGIKGVPKRKRRRRLSAIVAAELIESARDPREPSLSAEIVPLLRPDEVADALRARGLHTSGFDDFDRRTLRKDIVKEWKRYQPPSYEISESIVDDAEVHRSLLRRGLSTQGSAKDLRERLGVAFAKESADRDRTMRKILTDLQSVKITLMLTKRAMKKSTTNTGGSARCRDDRALEIIGRAAKLCDVCDDFVRIDVTQQRAEAHELHKRTIERFACVSTEFRERFERNRRLQAEHDAFVARIRDLDDSASTVRAQLERLLRTATKNSERAIKEDMEATEAARVSALRALQADAFARRYAKKARVAFVTVRRQVEERRAQIKASRERRAYLHCVLNRALDVRLDARLRVWGATQEAARRSERERFKEEASEVRETYESLPDPTKVARVAKARKNASSSSRRVVAIPKSKRKAERDDDSGETSIKIPTCAREGHAMTLVGGQCDIAAKYPKFVCDRPQCGRRSKGMRWTCDACELDYCLVCFPAPSSATAQPPPRRTLMYLSNRSAEVTTRSKIESALATMREDAEKEEDARTVSSSDGGSDDSVAREDIDLHAVDIRYDATTLQSIPVSLVDADYAPTWYHDTTHLDVDKHAMFHTKDK
eukprot:g1691.t1